jgi:hypothetical protein
MSLIDEARADAKIILQEIGFETDLKFTPSGGGDPIETKGLAVRRTDNLEYDDGSKKNSPFSSITVPMDVFAFTESYVSLKGWKVEFEDSQELVSYEIGETLPNRTLGIINMTLKDE